MSLSSLSKRLCVTSLPNSVILQLGHEQSTIVSPWILRKSRDLRPVELPLEFLHLCEVDKRCLHAGIDLSGLHSLLCCFELDDNLASFIVETFLELMDSV